MNVGCSPGLGYHACSIILRRASYQRKEGRMAMAYESCVNTLLLTTTFVLSCLKPLEFSRLQCHRAERAAYSRAVYLFRGR